MKLLENETEIKLTLSALQVRMCRSRAQITVRDQADRIDLIRGRLLNKELAGQQRTSYKEDLESATKTRQRAQEMVDTLKDALAAAGGY